MSSSLKSRFREIEKGLRRRYGRDISTPEARRRAWWHFQLLDHAFLRAWWWNIYQIAPDVWRSNQPSPGRLKRYQEKGIKTVINLRGEAKHSPFLFEQEACEKLGMTLHSVTMSARKLVPREDILDLIDLMRRAEKPFVMHCKSGSDRAGFASVIYLAVVERQPIAKARRQLHWKYLHLSNDDTGILDYVFDVYEADNAKSPISLEDWFRTRYDDKDLTRSWKAQRK